MTQIRAGREGANLTLGKRTYMTDDLSPLTGFIAGIDAPILFFNVGSAHVNIPGDWFGPALGTALAQKRIGRYGANVMGTLKRPVHALNIAQRIDEIGRKYSDCVVIATDACAGAEVGRFSLEEGMLAPGAGARKMLPPVGDFTLMACTFLASHPCPVTAIMFADGDMVRSLANRAADAIVAGLRLRQKRIAKKGDAVCA
jgi:putative sporulation protein YyaC